MSGTSRKHLATPDETIQAALDAWYVTGQSYKRGAELLGIPSSTVAGYVKGALKRGLRPQGQRTIPIGPDPEGPVFAAQQGNAPDFDMIHPVPEGMTLKGTSLLYDADGKVREYWNKSKPQGLSPDDAIQLADPKKIVSVSTNYDEQGRVRQQWIKERPEDAQLIEDVIKTAVSEYLADTPPITLPGGPKKFDADVIPWFQIGDAHIGMLAHEAETGANFDLKIAERELCAAFSILFDECAPRERCVINDLGDATHYENMKAVTEASGHPMDADGRFPKMIGVYARIMRFIVDHALEKFRFVDIIINRGNHSETNDIWMAELLRQVYAGTGRVNVLSNASVFIPYRMGNTFVMTHHGHKTPPARLAQVMSNDFRQDWGETEFRYIDVGHLHHKMATNEAGGCTIEMWNILAGKDGWNNNSGYRAHQSITRVDRSRTYGEVGRRVLPIKEIRDAIVKASGEHYIPPERRLVFSV